MNQQIITIHRVQESHIFIKSSTKENPVVITETPNQPKSFIFPISNLENKIGYVKPNGRIEMMKSIIMLRCFVCKKHSTKKQAQKNNAFLPIGFRSFRRLDHQKCHLSSLSYHSKVWQHQRDD